MSDHDVLVKELLEEQVPLRLESEPNWPEVLLRAGLDGASPPRVRLAARLRRPRVLVAAVILLALLGTGVAFAVDGVPWWESAPPPTNPKRVDWLLAPPADGSAFQSKADRARARTVAQAEGAELVAAPVGKDGYCLLVLLPGAPSHGPSCQFDAGEGDYRASDEVRAYARPASAGGPRWIVYGRIVDPKAATFDLSEAAGVRFRLPLQYGGFFLGNVPKERWGALSNQAGEGRILDGSGATLRTGCVSWGPGPERERAFLTGFRFWSEDGDDCRPELSREPTLTQMDLTRAEKLVEVTLEARASNFPAGSTIAIWSAPGEGGKECRFWALASPRPTPAKPSGSETGGSRSPRERPGLNEIDPTGYDCGRDRDRKQEHAAFGPILVGFHAERQGTVYRWIVDGHVDRDSGVARVELRSATGAVPLGYGHDLFLAELPGTSNTADDLPPGGPFVLVGYDSSGKEIHRLDLEQPLRRSLPPRSG